MADELARACRRGRWASKSSSSLLSRGGSRMRRAAVNRSAKPGVTRSPAADRAPSMIDQKVSLSTATKSFTPRPAAANVPGAKFGPEATWRGGTFPGFGVLRPTVTLFMQGHTEHHFLKEHTMSDYDGGDTGYDGGHDVDYGHVEAGQEHNGLDQLHQASGSEADAQSQYGVYEQDHHAQESTE